MSKKERINPWKTLSSTDIYENPWIKLVEHQVINPGGGKGVYGKVHYKNIAVGVLVLDQQQNTWLVGQHRYTLNEWSLEIPEGGCPPGEDALKAAQRELNEETGMTAKKWTQLMKVHLSNSVTDEVCFIFLAEDPQQGLSHLEESEADMEVIKLPFSEVIEKVNNGSITDSVSVIAVLKVALLMEQRKHNHQA